MDYRDVTKEDIKQYKKDIDQYMRYRNTMMWTAVGSFGGATMFLIMAFYLRGVQYQFFEFCIWMAVLSILGGVTLFILRSALFNSRINNRRRLIENAEEYQNDKE